MNQESRSKDDEDVDEGWWKTIMMPAWAKQSYIDRRLQMRYGQEN